MDGLDAVIAVAPCSLTTVPSYASLGLQFANRRRIAPQSISDQHVRRPIVGIGQSLFEEDLGRFPVARLRQVEIDRLAVCIHGAEQIHPLAGDPNKDFALTTPCNRRLISGPYAWIQRQIDVWS